MRAAYAVSLKDLRVFLESWRAMALALVLPSLLVLLVGQIRTTPATFQVLLASGAEYESQARAMASLLRESSAFAVTVETDAVTDPLEVLQRRKLDLICVFDRKGVHAYSAVTDPFRAGLLQRSMDGLQVAAATSASWAKTRSDASQKLAEAGNAIDRALAVFQRTAPAVDFQPDQTALATAVSAWSRVQASLSSPEAANGRDLAALIERSMRRVQDTLARVPAREATFDEGLSNDVHSFGIAVDLVTQLQPRTDAARPQIDGLKEAAKVLGGMRDALRSKLRFNRLAEFNAAGASLAAALDAVPVAFIDPDWAERLRNATAKAQPLMSSQNRDPFDARAVAEIVRDARELSRVAQSGEALAGAAVPTFLNSIAAPAPDPSLTLMYPVVGQRPRALLPEIIALVACFIPFVIAVQSLLREREEHTIEILLSAPHATRRSLFIGKLGLPLVCGLFNLGLNLVLVQWVHGLYVKPGVIAIVLVVLPAMLSSALIGLAASAWVRSAGHATIVAAVYFLVVTLFSGFLYPIASQDPRTVVAVSAVSPLTFVHPSMKAWLFGAPVEWGWPVAALLVHCIAAAALANLAYRRWVRSI